MGSHCPFTETPFPFWAGSSSVGPLCAPKSLLQALFAALLPALLSSSGGARDADHGERSRNPAPPSNPPRAPRPGACTRAAEAAAVATKRTHTRPDRVESPGPGWLLLPTSHASVLSPLQSQMVPELMASKKALVQKLRNTEVRRPMWFSTPPRPAPSLWFSGLWSLTSAAAPSRQMTPAEEDFIYKTLRQIERLLAIPDLTPAEAKMLRQNLGGSTSMEISAQASGDLKELLKRHSAGPKPRRKHGFQTSGPKMGPGTRVGQSRRKSGGGAAGRSGGGRRSREAMSTSAPADTSFPAIASAEEEPPARPLDDWSAITLFQDQEYQTKEAAKQGGFGQAKRTMKAQLDQHITLQEKELKRRAQLQDKYAEEQRRQLENWRSEEEEKARKRAAKLAAEKAELDRMLALKQKRELRQQEQIAEEDAAAIAKAKQDLQDEQDRLMAKKKAQAEYNLKVKLANDEERRTKAERMAKLHALEAKAVEEHKAIMLKQEQDREARIQAQADRLNKMMAIGSGAIAATQGRIDDDNKRIQRHAEKKEKELAAALKAKQEKQARNRREMVSGLNAQMQAQEERRLKEIADKKRVGMQYEEEAGLFARQDKEKAERIADKNARNQRELKAQIAARAAEGTAVDESAGWIATMDKRERTMNRDVLDKAATFLRSSGGIGAH
jgi:hypothetical protein